MQRRAIDRLVDGVTALRAASAGTHLGIRAIGGPVDVFCHAGGAGSEWTDVVLEHDLGLGDPERVVWRHMGEEPLLPTPSPAGVKRVQALLAERRSLAVILAPPALDLDPDTHRDRTQEFEKALECPVILMPQVHGGDLWAGYGAVVRALVRAIPWDHPEAERHTVSIVGPFFHRYEMDQQANLQECRRLLDALGVHSGPALPGGQPWPDMRLAHRSDLLLRMPTAGMSAAELGEVTGRSVIDCALPFGVVATRNWLTAVADEFALDARLLSGLIAREEQQVQTRQQLASGLLEGKRLAIVGDVATAAGWASLCLELNMDLRLVVLLGASLGGAETFRRLLAHAERAVPDGTTVLSDLPEEALLTLLSTGDIQAADLDLVIRPDLPVAGTDWVGLATLASGFPATRQHFLFPYPELGYNGAVAQTQRLVNLVAGDV